jgi:hypothetical protein
MLAKIKGEATESIKVLLKYLQKIEIFLNQDRNLLTLVKDHILTPNFLMREKEMINRKWLWLN